MSSSYSALLRRSKLASYHPSLEQVLTSSGGNLSRSAFGLKRPLPAATTTVSPFVRVNSLDNSQKRTAFRKGTREALFVHRWDETAHQVLTATPSSASPPTAAYPPTVQSRFVPAAFADQFGGIELGPEAARAEAEAGVARGPASFLDLTEQEFNRWIDSLTDRRQDFAAFVAADAARGRQGSAVESVNLYEHAQKAAKDLLPLLNQFLAQTSPSPLLADKLIPHPHRNLGLQYARVTPLESSLAPAVPGRVLGSFSSKGDRHGNKKMASVMGQAAELLDSRSAGLSSTNFFPDAAGERNPSQGRGFFVPTATVTASGFVNRAALAAERGRKTFHPSRAALTEASALAEHTVRLELEAVSAGPARAVLPGEQDFSGKLAAKRTADFGLTSLFDWSAQSGKGQPGQLGGRRPSYVQNQQRKHTRDRLRQRTAGQPRKKGDSAILDNLESLLKKP